MKYADWNTAKKMKYRNEHMRFIGHGEMTNILAVGILERKERTGQK